MPNHDVISAFLDNESFDPRALVTALAEESGRELLVDLIALRKLTQPDDMLPAATPPARPAPAIVRWAVAAAVVLMAVAGGYQLGERASESSPAPPAPTEIVKGEAWQPVPIGGWR